MKSKLTQIVLRNWGIRCSFHYLTTLLVGVLVIVAFYTARENRKLFDDQKARRNIYDSFSGCNLFLGKWAYDNNSYALYRGQECSFMDDGMACEKFGRKDLNYQHWRWQPHHCDLPRFNAVAMLEMLRGRRLVFVGDSLNRNQWVSMVRLVESSIPPAMKSVDFKFNGSIVTFKATRGLFESKQLQSMLGTGLMQTYWSLILTFGGDGLK